MGAGFVATATAIRSFVGSHFVMPCYLAPFLSPSTTTQQTTVENAIFVSTKLLRTIPKCFSFARRCLQCPKSRLLLIKLQMYQQFWIQQSVLINFSNTSLFQFLLHCFISNFQHSNNIEHEFPRLRQLPNHSNRSQWFISDKYILNFFVILHPISGY